MARQQKTPVAEELLPAVAPKSLFERVAGYLDANDWRYQDFPDRNYFSLSMHLEGVDVRIIVDTYQSEDWQRVLVYSILPVFVPMRRRAEALDAINRINHRLIYGNLEMDTADGEIRIRSVSEHDRLLGDDLIARAIHTNIGICETHFAALMAVCFGNADPATVTDMIERQREGTLQ